MVWQDDNKIKTVSTSSWNRQDIKESCKNKLKNPKTSKIKTNPNKPLNLCIYWYIGRTQKVCLTLTTLLRFSNRLVILMPFKTGRGRRLHPLRWTCTPSQRRSWWSGHCRSADLLVGGEVGLRCWWSQWPQRRRRWWCWWWRWCWWCGFVYHASETDAKPEKYRQDRTVHTHREWDYLHALRTLQR